MIVTCYACPKALTFAGGGVIGISKRPRSVGHHRAADIFAVRVKLSTCQKPSPPRSLASDPDFWL